MSFSINQLLRTSGLVILTGPLCFTAGAQTYIDLEAERAAAEAAGHNVSSPTTKAPPTTDPYGAQPAQAYPAISYGVSSAPAAPSSIAPTPAPAVAIASTAGSSSSGQNLGTLFSQIQQLQQEVMRLNGKVEEQAHELLRLKEQSLQRYSDLDQRLSGTSGATATPNGSSSAGSTRSTMPVVSAPVSGGSAKAQPGETGAYRAAYGLVQSKEFEQAIPAFQQFIQTYPSSQYAPNAHYWLGELYLVKQPPDLESSRQSFALLLSQYPDSPKAPDALYKLGKVQFMKGNREKAREYLDLVITQYEGRNNTVVKLARNFIAENY